MFWSLLMIILIKTMLYDQIWLYELKQKYFFNNTHLSSLKQYWRSYPSSNRQNYTIAEVLPTPDTLTAQCWLKTFCWVFKFPATPRLWPAEARWRSFLRLLRWKILKHDLWGQFRYNCLRKDKQHGQDSLSYDPRCRVGKSTSQ